MASSVISDFLQGLIPDERVRKEIKATMERGALNGGEIDSEEALISWFTNRFKPNTVILDRTDYSRALIRSLWIAPNLAALDFAGGRLRDFAQLWTDTARGFLGEIAVQKLLEKYNLNIHLDSRRGEVKEFMASDLLVKEEGIENPRPSKIKVSIKTTKLNGRWLEIPESQFRQSDLFVFVKLGISRYHFTSYLKETVKLLLQDGLKIKELDEEQVKTLTEEIPDWGSIPAYVSGFVDKEKLKLPIHALDFRVCRKRQSVNGVRPISRIEIDGGVGLFSESTLSSYEDIVNANIPVGVPMEIAGIGKEVDGNFYASSGLLKFGKEDWTELVKRI